VTIVALTESIAWAFVRDAALLVNTKIVDLQSPFITPA